MFPRTGFKSWVRGFSDITAVTLTTSGAIVAGTTVAATTTVTAGTGITATTGDVTSTAGNLVATAGQVDAAQGIVGYQKLFPAPTTDDTGSMTTTAGRAYAMYMGQAPRNLTSIDVAFYIHGVAAVAGGGGASVNWAEIAIATGAFENFTGGTSTDLTILAYTSIDTEAKIAATAGYQKTLTATITRGQSMWIVIAGSYETTQMSLRTRDGADIEGYGRIRAATQPSLNLSTPLAFTTTPGAAATATLWLKARID